MSVHPHRQKGFTLVEILLYTGIAGFIVLSLSLFLIVSLQSRIKNKTIREIGQDGSATMMLITQTIRNASAVNTPLAGASTDRLSLNVADPADTPTIFYYSRGDIYVQEGSATPVKMNSSQVSVPELIFTNLSQSSTSTIIRIQFSLSHKNPNNDNEYEYSQTFYDSASTRK